MEMAENALIAFWDSTEKLEEEADLVPRSNKKVKIKENQSIPSEPGDDC